MKLMKKTRSKIMSETVNTKPQIYEFQADEATGRLSEAENVSAPDQLSSVEKSDGYEELELPSELKECEENWQSFKTLANQLQLPAETVQRLLDWQAQTLTEGRKISEEVRGQILDKWTAQTKEMLGPCYQKHLTSALSAAQRFGGEELRELLDVTGLGNHPVIIKTFYEISKSISEDRSIGGAARSTTDKTFAEALYGKAD